MLHMVIQKSKGVTPTEEYLAALCERTFLKLWSYPNPWKEDGKELCDLLVVFEDDVLVFFDRESHRLKKNGADVAVEWPRWRKEVVDKQAKTAAGAARYLAAGRRVFLDPDCRDPLPVAIPKNARIHKIVVAHGAKEACRRESHQNVTGSLAIAYAAPTPSSFEEPFFVSIDKNDPYHIFDSENLSIVLTELDTIYDFVSYLNAKIQAIEKYAALTYCGEEDLIAHYLLNFDKKSQAHFIGVKEEYDFIHISEGEYSDFIKTDIYQRRKSANDASRSWDKLIQFTADNALQGTLLGDANPFDNENPMHYMAKEPRFIRRTLSERIERAINDFPESDAPNVRNLTLLPSFYEGMAYVFLQLKVEFKEDNLDKYREIRTKMLEVACAAAKIKFPRFKKIVGIAMDSPKYAKSNSEDFILMKFDNWTREVKSKYENLNKELKFFKVGKVKRVKVSEFPALAFEKSKERKIGRNEKCPCGSGKKYKHCHYR